MEKHWTQFLQNPEPWATLGQDQLAIKKQIWALREEIAKLEARYYDRDNEIRALVAKHRGFPCIADAQFAAAIHNSNHPHEEPSWTDFSKIHSSADDPCPDCGH